MDDTTTDPGPIGRGLARARGDASMTLAGAADRTKSLGAPIHRVAIGKMEAGERVPTISELFALAVAYDTSPASMLFGGFLVDGLVELVPGRKVSAVRALQWFSGEKALSDDTLEAGRYRYNNLDVSVARDLERARDTVKFAAAEFREQEDVGILEAAIRGKIRAVDVAKGSNMIVVDDG